MNVRALHDYLPPNRHFCWSSFVLSTCDAETEFAMGHESTEMSCPITTSPAGVSYLIHYKTKTNYFISLWNLKYVALNFGSHLIHMLYRVLVSISL